MAPGISTLDPLRGVLFTDVGSSQTVSGLQPLGQGEHLLEWGRACTCYFSAGGFVSPSSDHTQLAVLQLSTRGQTRTPSPHSFEGCGASPSAPTPQVDLEALTLSLELIQV